MPEQYETLSKFDRAFAGLQGGNNLPTKPTTIEYVEPLTGDAETYIIQTVRAEYRVKKGMEMQTRVGDFIVIKFADRDGMRRLLLPPQVAETILRQHDALTSRRRSITSKATMRERMDRGELPGFMKAKKA